MLLRLLLAVKWRTKMEFTFVVYTAEDYMNLMSLANLFDFVEEDEDDDFEDCFEEDEIYVYDEEAECYCWYDEEHEAWYWLDEESREWLLVEDEEEAE